MVDEKLTSLSIMTSVQSSSASKTPHDDTVGWTGGRLVMSLSYDLLHMLGVGGRKVKAVLEKKVAQRSVLT